MASIFEEENALDEGNEWGTQAVDMRRVAMGKCDGWLEIKKSK